MLVAHTLAPSRWKEEQLLEAVRANVAIPTLELMWGSPGTMLAAQVMHERMGAPVWVKAWNASADHLWDARDGELWCQDFSGRHRHVLGAAHGFAGNDFVLARGDLLDRGRRASSSGVPSPRLRSTPTVRPVLLNGRRRSRRHAPGAR